MSPNLFPSGATGAFPPPPYFLRRALLPASPERSRLPSCAGGDRAGSWGGLGSRVAALLPSRRRPARPRAGCGFRLRPLSRDEEAGRATRVMRAQGFPVHPLRNSRRPSQVPAGVRGAEAGRAGSALVPGPPEAEGALGSCWRWDSHGWESAVSGGGHTFLGLCLKHRLTTQGQTPTQGRGRGKGVRN